MIRQLPARQRIRKALLILAFLSFPITMNFLSPYVVIDGAMGGVLTGSLVMFGLMFLSALFLGRLWCGWACPGAGMQEIAGPLNNRAVHPGKIDWIKWVIWVPWISLIVWLVFQAGGSARLDLLYLTENGVSVSEPSRFFVYYMVVGVFILLAALVGRRAGCHTICWMAPFMILGRWIRNRFAWPALRLRADAAACQDCKVCTQNCPMSLDVNAMVQRGHMEHPECILCGSCVDNCASRAIRYSFSSGK
ncbi:MAG: 4Fe-4S binding protein [Chloroflexi bacterium]|nr:4Fe-4S binding protein [Anaerolineaceae bacterium]NMB88416.1 4Fe-4S binding protein [Chloroflexota bacterium]